MIYQNIPHSNIKDYRESLQIIGSLSGLFSDSAIPYLYYRIAERCFCDAMKAKDCSRSDVSFDAVLNDVGIGLKTFLHSNGQTFQKVAEFNQLRTDFGDMIDTDLVTYIASARNQRLETTLNQYGVDKMIYHLVTRVPERFYIYETDMSIINMNKLKILNVNRNANTVHFTDGKNAYSFNKAKSTLLKKFMLRDKTPMDEIRVGVMEDPLEELKKLKVASQIKPRFDMNQVVLPLYVTKKKASYDVGDVPRNSGLNQAFAGGRERDANELYIPVSRLIHDKFPNFFPDNNQDKFKLIMPNGSVLSAKMCQSGSKGLMSNPNKALGKWLLRDVLKLNENQLATREILDLRGIDCVIVTKKNSSLYEIDFGGLGRYEEFHEKHLID